MSKMVPRLDIPFLNGLLQGICGEPLTDMWRGLGQIFEFGVQRPATNKKGEAITYGTFDLKFTSADWRIVRQGRVLLGSFDHSLETRFYDPDEPAGQPYDVEARVLVREFFDDVSSARLIVESVEVSVLADITILLTGDTMIQSFGSSGEDHDLWWCLDRRTDVSCLVGPGGHHVGGPTLRNGEGLEHR